MTIRLLLADDQALIRTGLRFVSCVSAYPNEEFT